MIPFFHLSIIETILVILLLTHITIISVTIYLHRFSAHRSLELSPVVTHFFRFWLWLTTGMVTKEWTAVHRKHHAKCETNEDPHSPIIYGIKKVLLEGSELYRKESLNEETLKRYGSGTPDDWMENHIYRHSICGVSIMLVLDVVLFGAIGITIWAIQMIWIPFWAAGVINGLAHFWGYKNFTVDDASTNIFPIGILIGGEELHNNHHAYGTSAKLSNKWFEFDIGWMYIKILSFLKLAKIKKIHPKIKLSDNPVPVSLDTLNLLITNRFDLMQKYKIAITKEVISLINTPKVKNLSKEDLNILYILRGNIGILFSKSKFLNLNNENFEKFEELSILIEMKSKLTNIWENKDLTKSELISLLNSWCEVAENSSVDLLKAISLRIRSYSY